MKTPSPPAAFSGSEEDVYKRQVGAYSLSLMLISVGTIGLITFCIGFCGIFPVSYTHLGTGFFKEVNQIPQGLFRKIGSMQHDIRNTAVGMRQHGSLKCFFVHKCHGLALEEIKAVDILGIIADEDILFRLVKEHNGLKERAAALLNILAHGMQIRGEHNGRREQALVILALTLTEELLPPLVHHRNSRLIADANLRLFPTAVQAARGLIDTLTSHGYTCVTVDELRID